MKEAEVIDKHSALMICEICDYSNSHKNKKWQEYSAVTIAAYAKKLLGILHVHEIDHDSEMQEKERRRDLKEELQKKKKC